MFHPVAHGSRLACTVANLYRKVQGCTGMLKLKTISSVVSILISLISAALILVIRSHTLIYPKVIIKAVSLLRVCLNCLWEYPCLTIYRRIFIHLVYPREATIYLKPTSSLLIFAVIIFVMVLQSSNPASISPGLLPAPIHQTNKDNADPFVGQSYYPLPYPLMIILEGSQLFKLISWDILVSSTQVKLKLEWSTSSDDSDCSPQSHFTSYQAI